jgi:hypothetical protein
MKFDYVIWGLVCLAGVTISYVTTPNPSYEEMNFGTWFGMGMFVFGCLGATGAVELVIDKILDLFDKWK